MLAHRPAERASPRAGDDPALRADDPVDDVRLHDDAAVRDAGGDHRHLHRRDLELGLPEREPAGVDLARVRRLEWLAPAIEPADPALVGRRFQRGQRVEPEVLHLLHDRVGPELLADLAEDRVDRVLDRLEERDQPERARRVVVVHAPAVLDAVARVGPARLHRVLAALERRRRGDDLERRAGDVRALRRAVEERRGPRAVGARAAVDLAIVALDEVRVVRRGRDHHEHAAARRLDRDDGAAPPAERPQRHALRAGVQRQHEVVADDVAAEQLVDVCADDRAQVRVRARQEVVHRLLEPGARAHLRRVADDVRGEPSRRVAPEVERAAADLARPVAREDGSAVRGVDRPALDRELRDGLDRVLLPLREPGCRPRLPVRRRQDQRADQREREDGEPADRAVHERGAFARFETSSRPARRTKFASRLEPP